MSAGTFNQPTQGGYAQQPVQAQAQTSGKATASLVLGILAVVLFIVWGSLIFGPLAIIFGVMARNEIKRNPAKGGYGSATAGMILGIAGLALWAVFLVIGLAMM
jgi:Domain of unknown function (DUF4190)